MLCIPGYMIYIWMKTPGDLAMKSFEFLGGMGLIDIDDVMVPHRVVPIKGDGSYFFYTLSYFMYGTDSLVPQTHMSLHTPNATQCEIRAADEICPYHLMVYRDGKAYDEKNLDVNRETVNKYNEKNPEVHKEAVRKYTEKNPDVTRAAVKRYNEANHDLIRASVSRYANKHPELPGIMSHTPITTFDWTRIVAQLQSGNTRGKKFAVTVHFRKIDASRFWRRFREIQNIEDRPRTSRPRVTIAVQDHYVQISARRRPNSTTRALRNIRHSSSVDSMSSMWQWVFPDVSYLSPVWRLDKTSHPDLCDVIIECDVAILPFYVVTVLRSSSGPARRTVVGYALGTRTFHINEH
uniref:Uncharacterized protein n=1 Tax=Timema douglasi TaxID=61478 RepID=A0A7R8VE97_TIMDO|nr:unnamed protein product [Timema douglasi]